MARKIGIMIPIKTPISFTFIINNFSRLSVGRRLENFYNVY
jgi:hypothetical protein